MNLATLVISLYFPIWQVYKDDEEANSMIIAVKTLREARDISVDDLAEKT